MKIINRTEFMAMPAGTLFCKGSKWCFDNISVKGQSWETDFLFVDLCMIDAHDSGELVDRLEDSLTNGTSYPINNNPGRDGMFEEAAVFLIFEEDDMKFIIDLLKISIEALRHRPVP